MKPAALNHDLSMVEYLSQLPFFYTGVDDDQPCIPCQGAAPSEEIWKKFELIPTPPLSPEHDGSVESDNDAVTYASELTSNTTETLTQVSDSLMDCAAPLTPPPNDFVDTSKHVIPDNQYEDQSSGQKLIKDCMWNGCGHKPHSEVPRRWRDDSPASASLIPANGFVDPKSVFPEQRCEIERRHSIANPPVTRRRSDGAESPSDSDEEIDVVTVEKASPHKASGTTTTLGVLSQGRKVVGTLVSRLNGAHRQLALVTSNGNRIRKRTHDGSDKENQSKAKTKFQVSKTERNGQQTVTMVINNVKPGADGNGKPVNFQLKTLPVMTTSVGSNGLTTKRRFSSPNHTTTTVTPVMRLSASSNNVINGPPPAKKPKDSLPGANANPSQPAVARRPIFSLQGISMVTDTGVMRNKSDPSFSTKKETPSSQGLHPTGEQVYVVSTGTDALSEKRKASKKVNKTKQIAAPLITYDTPASSPASSTGDSSNPASPRKHRAISGESNSSATSGSDEEIRAAHNVLERQRREGLRTSFHTLRKCVPELADTERAPKVHILKKAKEYSLHLQDEQMRLEVEKSSLHETNMFLHQKLRDLLNEISSVQPVSFASPVKCERGEMLHHSTCGLTYSSDEQECSDDSDANDIGDEFYPDAELSSEEEEHLAPHPHLGTAVYVSTLY